VKEVLSENSRWGKLKSEIQETWEKTKNKRLEQCLKPYTLVEGDLKEPDNAFNRLKEEIAKRNPKTVDEWLQKEGTERSGGFRAQKCFSEMLFTLKVGHDSELKYLNPDFDFKVSRIGTIEVKHIPFGKEVSIFNIKESAWKNKPSLYLAVLKGCDEDLKTFQLAGWLYGHEVFQLNYQPKDKPLYPRAHYWGTIDDLRRPKTLLKILLEVAWDNPFR
jgi:hypothetical protein